MAAATCAALRGARVVLIDENAVPGGQVHRAAVPGVGVASGPDAREGDRLRAALVASGAEVRSGQRVWALGGGPLVAPGVAPAPFRLDACSDAATATIEARSLIVCAGAHERIIPFVGWTLPGVMGLAAATILLKSQAVLPGTRTVVAGTGPLLAAVAAGILAKGGRVVGVVDLASRTDWLRQLPTLAERPPLLARGAAWLARIVWAGVPLLSGHRVVRALGAEAVEAVEVAPLKGGVTRRLDCDALCVGHGLVPAIEATLLYRAEHVFRRARGGWVPVLDGLQRSTVPLLYAAGDGAGVEGAAAAPLAGEIAALAALADLRLLAAADAEHAIAARRSARTRPARVGAAMSAMMAPPGDLVDRIPPDCVVCRCEDVVRAELEAAADVGARDLNQLKHFTRCGMGPCQGRMCGEAAAELLARRVGSREAVGIWTARVPLRPVPMAALLDRFDYADIPIPAPAPI